jgi:hypothetical protein
VITSLIALLNGVRHSAVPACRPGAERENGGLGKSAIGRPLGRS